METAIALQTEKQLAVWQTSPQAYYKALPSRSFTEIFDSHAPALGQLQAKDIKLAQAAVVIFIDELNRFFGIKDQMAMSVERVQITCELILDEYPFLQIDDLKACSRNAMKLKYGKVYDRLDGQIIMGWLQQYVNDRRLAADEISYNEHLRHKSENSQPMEIHGGVSYDQYREWLKTEATKGNKQAIELLELSNENMSKLKPVSRHKFSDAEKEKEFQRYREEYNARRRHLDAL